MRDRRRQWSLALRHFVHFDQRHTSAGPVGATDLGRVGSRRQGQNQRRVFAAVHEAEGASVAGGLRRRGGISGDDTPVVVFSDGRGPVEDPETSIGGRTRDAEGREARSNRADEDFFGALPVTIKPPIKTFSPVATSPRVEILISR